MNVNVDKLQSIRKDNPSADKVFRFLRKRTRGRQDTTFRRLRRVLSEDGLKLPVEELAKIFKALQDAGAGRVVFSKNKPARFVWEYNLKSVVDTALGEAKGAPAKQAPMRKTLPPVKALTRTTGTPSAVIEAQQVPTTEANGEKYAVIRRAGFEMTVPLAGLTPTEAQGAANLLTSLEKVG